MLDTAGPAPDTLRVALLSPVDARHAPLAATDDERLVFRQLYETLVRVDCAGAVRPGLAVTWRAENDGARWIFELAPGARFWDGAPVDAAAVRASWTGTPALPVADVQPWGATGIAVSLAAPRAVAAFGDAAWSIVKRIPESAWPIGTGPVWVRGWDTDRGARVLRAVPTPLAPGGTPVLEFRDAGGADPRDALDQAADLMVTRDAGALRYARGRSDWRSVSLPWDRVYALASPLRIRTGTTTQLDAAALRALAADAVRDDARAPAGAPWWDAQGCAPTAPGPAGSAGPARDGRVAAVVARAGDRVAGDLVTRLVARADAELRHLLGEPVGALRAAALDAGAYDAQLAAGGAPAFVVALPRDPADPCLALGALRARIPWLGRADIPAAALLAPLVETRAHLLVRGAARVAWDGDGGVRVLPGRVP